MKFDIYEKKVIGVLCYNAYDIHELGSLIYPQTHRLIQLFNKIIEENGLTSYYYYDMTLNRYYFRLDGSITNMLRFRNKLRSMFNLNELSDWY